MTVLQLKKEIKRIEKKLTKLREQLLVAEKLQSGKAPCPSCGGQGTKKDWHSGHKYACTSCGGDGFWNGKWST